MLYVCIFYIRRKKRLLLLLGNVVICFGNRDITAAFLTLYELLQIFQNNLFDLKL